MKLWRLEKVFQENIEFLNVAEFLKSEKNAKLLKNSSK